MTLGAISRRRRQWLAFTLAEVLVVISIIGILALLLMPSLVAAKRRALMVHCAGNIRQIALATIMYATTTSDFGLPYINGDWLCPAVSEGGSSWGVGFRRVISPLVGGKNTIFWCPADARPHYPAVSSSPINWWYGSYGINACIGVRVRNGCLNTGRNNYFYSNIKSPAAVILIAEDVDDHTVVPTKYWPASGWCVCSIFLGNGTRHNGKGNVAFCDGHVELVSEDQTLPPPDGSGGYDMWVPPDGRPCSF